jgi:hypothetical protein
MTTPSPLRVLTLAGLLVAASAAASESSIACDGGNVRPGDTKVDLIGKCGEPALRDVSIQERGVAIYGVAVATVAVEQWTYNFGPNRFLQVVTLEAGRVVRIERGSYGYPPEQLQARRDGPPCDSSVIKVGDRKLDLLARCGEPTTRDLKREERLVTVAAGRGATGTRLATVEIETWIYDLGPRRFMAIVTIEDGAVSAVEHGGYGYRQ